MKLLTGFSQGDPEWFQARLGIPTASNFDRIITPAKGEFSKSARGYALYLAAETLLGQTLDNLDHVQWIERGRVLEPEAVRAYQLLHDLDDTQVQPIGFITTDDGMVGASPDRLLMDGKRIRGGLEIKCPAPQTHIGYLVDGPGTDYRCQVQGQLWVAELEYVDFFSYHPAMPAAVHRQHRDEAFIAKIAAAMAQFTELRLSVLEEARSRGYFEAAKQLLTPADQRAREAA